MKKINKKYISYVLFGMLCLFCFKVNAFADNCPLGPNVTKDIRGLFKIFSYCAPALVVVLTAYEAIQSFTKGNFQDEVKKLTNRLMKRILYAVLLFAVPTLINVFGELTGILPEDQKVCLEDIQNGTTAMVYVVDDDNQANG